MVNKESTITRSCWKVVKHDNEYTLERKVKMTQVITYTEIREENNGGKPKTYTARNLAQEAADFLNGCEADGREGYAKKKETFQGCIAYKDLLRVTLAAKAMEVMSKEQKKKS